MGGGFITTDEYHRGDAPLVLERSVIGLNLCPFAESVYRGDRVRFRVSEQRSPLRRCCMSLRQELAEPP